MKLINSMRLFAIVAALGIQFLHPAAEHRVAPTLQLDAVDFDGSRPVFDADGKLLATTVPVNSFPN